MKRLFIALLLTVPVAAETFCVATPSMPSVYDYDGMERAKLWMTRALEKEGYEVGEPCDYTVFAYALPGSSGVLGLDYAVIGPSPRFGTLYVWPETFSTGGAWTLTVKRTGRLYALVELHGTRLNERLLMKAVSRLKLSHDAKPVSNP